MTIFRGRVNHHFRAVLAIVWEDVTSSMLAQPKKKVFVLVLKRFNYATYFEVAWIII